MLNHGIVLQSGNCRLRPIAEADEKNVVGLWNRDYVIGTLWSGATTVDKYRACFERYKSNPNSYQFVVENNDGDFCGTIGFDMEGNVATFSYFALCPKRGFLAVVPCVLLFNHILNVLKAEKVAFTCNVQNVKAKRVYAMLRAKLTDKVDMVVSQYGVSSIREHWEYRRSIFNENKDYFKSEFAVEMA